MFLRTVSMSIRSEQSTRIAAEYDKNIMTALRIQEGCNFASLLQNVHDPKDCISLTIWDSKEKAAEYERSGVFKKLVESLRAFYEETNDFEIKLTEDLSIDYVPVQQDPTVEGYDDLDTHKEFIRRLNVTPYVVKIITVKAQADKIEEFEAIFVSEVMPIYQAEKGFIHIILLRRGSTFTIVSFWDETIDFAGPEGGSQFDLLTKSVYAILPKTIQWQLTHKENAGHYVSSDAIKASVYRCLLGEWFNN